MEVAQQSASVTSMNNLSGRIAAGEVLPGIAFSFEFPDSAILIHYLPAPEGDKPAIGRSVYSIVWILNFVSHDA